jgi:hypothetical protein
MNALRWLLHLARCHYYRWQARDALESIECAHYYARRNRERLARATARELEEQHAWDRWRKQVRESSCAD